jgi:predicted nucleotidyltransferase
MTSEFNENISRFLRPISELNGIIPNETYFLTHDDLFVFVEGYCHPNGKIHGKIIYYPDDTGSYDYYGRRYSSSFKKIVNNELVLLDHNIQLQTQYIVRPDLKPTFEMPVHSEYRVEFDINEFKGFFDHNYSLELMMQKYSVINDLIHRFSKDFDIDIKRIGATGSLSFGIFDEEDDDLDLVFYGKIKENQLLMNKIRNHCNANPDNVVKEFGKVWPIRFFYQGMLFCPFYCYSDLNEIPVKDFNVKIIDEKINFKGEICNDTHSIYFPVFLEMKNCSINGKKTPDIPVLIYDSSLRGEYYEGHVLKITGRLADIVMGKKTVRLILATLVDQITLLN